MNGPLQLDLFRATPAPRDPVFGLAVRLPDPCRCNTDVARVGSPVGPHLAELRCARCERHRGWLPRQAHTFLVETIQKFGKPTEPILIGRGRQP